MSKPSPPFSSPLSPIPLPLYAAPVPATLSRPSLCSPPPPSLPAPLCSSPSHLSRLSISGGAALIRRILHRGGRFTRRSPQALAPALRGHAPHPSRSLVPLAGPSASSRFHAREGGAVVLHHRDGRPGAQGALPWQRQGQVLSRGGELPEPTQLAWDVSSAHSLPSLPSPALLTRCYPHPPPCHFVRSSLLFAHSYACLSHPKNAPMPKRTLRFSRPRILILILPSSFSHLHLSHPFTVILISHILVLSPSHPHTILSFLLPLILLPSSPLLL